MPIPALTTDRLILRAFTERDIDALHRVFSDPEVHRYFPRTDPPSREQVEKIIERQLTHWQEHGCGWWAVVWRESQELIGWCGLQFLPEFGETEVAYLLGKPYWGKGFATEAAWAAVRFGFQTLGLERLVAIAHVENAASHMTKCMRACRGTGLPTAALCTWSPCRQMIALALRVGNGWDSDWQALMACES